MTTKRLFTLKEIEDALSTLPKEYPYIFFFSKEARDKFQEEVDKEVLKMVRNNDL